MAATPTRVQEFGGASASSPCASSTQTVTANNMLLVVAAATTAALTPALSISDTLGNTWTLIVSKNDGAAHTVSFWYAKNIVGGSTAITVTGTNSPTEMAVSVLEVSGADLVTPIDGSASASATASQSANSGQTAGNCALSNDLIVGLGGARIATGSISARQFGSLLASRTDETIRTQGTTNACISDGPMQGSHTEGFTFTAGTVCTFWAAACVAISAVYTRGYYSSLILSDGPRMYYRCTDPKGYIRDYSGNGLHIGLGGFTGLTFGQVGPLVGDGGTAIAGDGTESGPAQTAPGNISAPYTIEVWCKATSGSGAMVSSRTNGLDHGFDMQVNVSGNQVHADVGDGTNWINTAMNATLTWGSTYHHIVYVITSSAYTIYVDGVQAATGSLTAGAILISGNRWLSLFKSDPAIDSNAVNGSLAEVAIYTSALTATQVLNHYKAGTALDPVLRQVFRPQPALVRAGSW